MTVIVGTPVLLQFITFPPGTFISENVPRDPGLGYPTVVLLQNLGDPLLNPKPKIITDFCTPLASTATFFGVTKDNTDTVGVDEGGVPLLVNPQDGSYIFTAASNGQRDADGDGYENSLDTCPLTPNFGDPRISGSGDMDADGLDAACDPNDILLNGGTDSDEDADGYPNRHDNCPLVPNGVSQDFEQTDADFDQIGDVCDPNPNSADTEGVLSLDESSFTVAIGTGTGTGGPPDCPSPGCWSLPTPTTPAPTTPASSPTDLPATQTPGGLPASGGPDESGSSMLVVTLGLLFLAVFVIAWRISVRFELR